MRYDLNIAWSPTTSAADLERTLKFSASLGYNVVALNHDVSAPIPGQITNPLPKFAPPPPSPGSKPESNYDLPVVLHRATVDLANPSVNHRLAHLAAAYDVLAVRPRDEKQFQAACLNLTDASVISLDLAQLLPFHFRPKPCMAAVHRGARFEVCYAQFLAADARGRGFFVGNVMNLARATRGRGFVVSSGARGVTGLRAPADVVNLLAVWGLATDKGMEAVGVNPRAVVVNEGIKRSAFRGIVDIVEVAEREEGGDKMEVDQEAAAEAAAPKAKEQGGGNKNGGGNGRKRKEQQGVDGQAPMSKRQQKKMKLAVVDGKS